MKINIKEYIASGKIEEYVLGVLPSEQQEEVEKIARQYPEVQKEIALAQASLEVYANGFAKNPPDDLKIRILDELATLSLDEAENKQQSSHLSVSTKQAAHTINAAQSNYRFPLMAASIALIMSLLGNIILYQNWKNTENKLQTALVNNEQFAQRLQVNQTQNQSLDEELALLKNPQTQYVTLSGSEKYPDAKARVYWDKQSKKVFLQIQNLPPPPSGMQYQLWAVYQDRATDAGVFEMRTDNSQLQKMKNISQADMFVVTLEKEGGVPQPEGEAYSIGKTS